MNWASAVNPFDPKTVFLAKHAQHVVLVHFPIALFIMGAGFDFAAQWMAKKSLAVVARYNFLAAAVFTFPTLATGILAWRIALEGEHLKGILLMHLVFAWTSSALIWLVGWLHYRTGRDPRLDLPRYRLVLEAAGVVFLSITGHLGGFLSGINGPG